MVSLRSKRPPRAPCSCLRYRCPSVALSCLSTNPNCDATITRRIGKFARATLLNFRFPLPLSAGRVVQRSGSTGPPALRGQGRPPRSHSRVEGLTSVSRAAQDERRRVCSRHSNWTWGVEFAEAWLATRYPISFMLLPALTLPIESEPVRIHEPPGIPFLGVLTAQLLSFHFRCLRF